MATQDLDPATALRALEVLEELVSQQRSKVRALALRIHPGLTEEQLGNLHDVPDVQGDPRFRFEDGQLAGFVSAEIALRARLLDGALPC